MSISELYWNILHLEENLDQDIREWTWYDFTIHWRGYSDTTILQDVDTYHDS